MSSRFFEVFNRKPVIGMVHTNGDSTMSILELAQTEIEIYLRHGVCPLVEDYYGTEDDCEEVLEWLQATHADVTYGINILGDHTQAFALANKYGAKFIQIDSVCGDLPPEEEESFVYDLNEHRKHYEGIVLGGVRFKYYDVLSGRSQKEDLILGIERCDAIVCTGSGTGIETPLDKVDAFKATVGDFPVIVGAGVTSNNAAEAMQKCDGLIVGSWFKYKHDAYNMVNEQYVSEFMEKIGM